MKPLARLALIVLLLASASSLHAQKFDSLALTPPMGWNSWNTFACNVDEQLIRTMADAMVATGLKDAGYTYIVIDDCWHGKRDSLGFIHPNPQRFPSGIKALADYIHSQGLKFGIYSCAGDSTCAGYAGSRGHEYQDALSYASWGVDYLKYDWCNSTLLSAPGAYMTMRNALYAARRPVVFSICEWGTTKPWTWARDIGHLWRTTGDITSQFDGELNHGTWSQWGVMKIAEMRDSNNIRQHAGPGHWNDPDMLEVGNGMSVSEDRAHFSLWCMMAAPLMAGNDIRKMSKQTGEILTNPEVIAVDQDSLGIQGFRHERRDSIELWAKPLRGGDWALCFLNRSGRTHALTIDWATVVIHDSLSKRSLDTQKQVYTVRDLWARKDLRNTGKKLSTSLGSHDVLMLRLRPAKE